MCSLAPLGMNFHRAAKSRSSLTHPREPEPSFRCGPGGEPNTIIFDLQRDLISSRCKPHCEIARSGVLGQIMQGFLNSSVESHLDVVVYVSNVFWQFQVRLHSCMLGKN